MRELSRRGNNPDVIDSDPTTGSSLKTSNEPPYRALTTPTQQLKMSPPTPPTLLTLPLEIRRQIYLHLLHPRPSPTAFQQTFPLPILLLNHQLHTEASDTLYRHNTFSIEIEPISPPLQKSFAALSTTIYFPLVRHYTLNITLTTDPHWSSSHTTTPAVPANAPNPTNAPADSSASSGERARLRVCLQNHCALLATVPRLRRLDLHVTGWLYDAGLEGHLWALEPLRVLRGRVERVVDVWTRTGSGGFRFGFLRYRPSEEERVGVVERQAVLEKWRGEMRGLLEGRGVE